MLYICLEKDVEMEGRNINMYAQMHMFRWKDNIFTSYMKLGIRKLCHTLLYTSRHSCWCTKEVRILVVLDKNTLILV